MQSIARNHLRILLILLGVITLAFVSSISFANAQETSVSGGASANASTTAPKKPGVRAIQGEIRQIKQDRNDTIKDLRKETKGEVKTMRADFKANATTSTTTRKEFNASVKERVGEMRDDIKLIRASSTEMIMAKREQLKNLVAERLDKVKEFRLERKELFKGKKPEEKKELAGKASENALKGFAERISRMEEVAAKLRAAITKGETAGKDMARAKTLLGEAEVKITAAKGAYDILKASITATLSSETSKGIGSDVRAKMKAVVEAIVAGEKALRDTNKAIRVAFGLQAESSISNTGVQATTTATSTASTTTQ